MMGEKHKTSMTFTIPVLRNLVVEVVLEHLENEDDGSRIWGLVKAKYEGEEQILDDCLPLSQYLGDGSHLTDDEWARIDAAGERLSKLAAQGPEKEEGPGG